MGDDFNLKKSLQWGLLPDAVNAEKNGLDPREFLSSYVTTYLKEEVYAEGLLRNLASFARFLESVSFSQGQPLVVTNIANDIGVNSKLIVSYVEILEDLLLAIRIPVFTKRAKRRMTTHPKFFLFDCGVYRTLRPKGVLDSEEELDGASLETLFLQHYRALGEAVKWDQQLYFWRSAAKAEIDFVSYGQAGLFAFEIKRSSMIRSEELTALRQFKSDYPEAKCFFVYSATEDRTLDGIRFLGFESALKIMPELFGVKMTL